MQTQFPELGHNSLIIRRLAIYTQREAIEMHIELSELSVSRAAIIRTGGHALTSKEWRILFITQQLINLYFPRLETSSRDNLVWGVFCHEETFCGEIKAHSNSVVRKKKTPTYFLWWDKSLSKTLHRFSVVRSKPTATQWWDLKKKPTDFLWWDKSLSKTPHRFSVVRYTSSKTLCIEIKPHRLSVMR